jgi:hypothetical protein
MTVIWDVLWSIKPKSFTIKVLLAFFSLLLPYLAYSLFLKMEAERFR